MKRSVIEGEGAGDIMKENVDGEGAWDIVRY